MTDRELLALAAIVGIDGAPKHLGVGVLDWVRDCRGLWNPLEDDGDALRLAVKLGMEVSCDGKDKVIVGWPDPHHPSTKESAVFYSHVTEPKACDPLAATRRAIVRAAAALAS